MNLPQLIALHAPDHGGKDTTAGVIRRVVEQTNAAPDSWVPFASRSFATKMKQSIGACFGIPLDQAVEWCDRLKQPGMTVSVRQQNEHDIIASTTGRQFIRDFATAGHRNLFDPDFWVNLLLPDEHWHRGFDCAAFCVITDLRFSSEADRVRDMGGQVWSITGRGEPFDAEHLSNGDFKWQTADQILDNSGSISDLFQEVAVAMKSLG